MRIKKRDTAEAILQKVLRQYKENGYIQEAISEHLVESGLFAETEIVKQVKAMSVEPQRQMTQDQWESLYKTFCEHFPALSRDLISLNINSHALRVCMLDRVYFFPS